MTSTPIRPASVHRAPVPGASAGRAPIPGAPAGRAPGPVPRVQAPSVRAAEIAFAFAMLGLFLLLDGFAPAPGLGVYLQAMFGVACLVIAATPYFP